MPAVVGDASTERPFTDARRDGSVDLGGGSADAQTTADRPPVVVSSSAIRLVPGRAHLVGTHESGCSNGTPGTGDRWCAFTQSGQQLGTTELWTMNITRALAGTAIKCDGTDSNCRRLTTRLWTGQPSDGPAHPTTHRFDGDVLIYHADADANLKIYQGPIYAWKPQWTEPRRLTSGNGVTCAAHFSADVALCITNIRNVEPPTFDLTAGRIGTGPLPLVAKIYPVRANQATQWKASFTRNGNWFAWSTGSDALTERETLYVAKTDDLPEIGTNPASAKRIEIAADISQWQISIDDQKWYFLREFNYDVQGEPSGTLTMSDFPLGGNEKVLAPNVGAFQLLFDGTEKDRGIGFFDNIVRGRGAFKIIKDRNNPMNVIRVVPNVSGVVVSPDLRFALYNRDFDENTGLADVFIAKTDGTVPCTLTTSLEADVFGKPFTFSGGLVFWADRIDLFTTVGEGFVANPDGCTNRRKWTDGMDFWFLHPYGMVFSDEGDGEVATLKHVAIPGGSQMGTPVRVQSQIRRIFSLLPDFSGVIFEIGSGQAAVDGIYLEKLPFTAPASGPDAGPAQPDSSVF